MSTRRSGRIAAAAAIAIVATCLGLAGCGGDDAPSKTEFVTELRRITDPPIERGLAECTYDKVVDDPVLLSAALKDSSVKLPDDVSKQLTRRLQQCMNDEADRRTTTTKATTTPTTTTREN